MLTPLATLLLCTLPLGACNDTNLVGSSFDAVVACTLRYHHIANVAIFIGDKDEHHTARNAILDSLERQLPVPRYIFTAADTSIPPGNTLRHHIANDALFVVLCATSADHIWRVVDQRLRKLRRTKLIVMATSTSLEPLDVFAKLWQLQFLHVVLLYNNTVYRYTPFPQIHMYQVHNRSADLFPPAPTNLQGYTLSTPAENDLPRIFFVRQQRDNATKIRGFAYQMFVNFVRRMNMTLRISNPNQVHDITSSVNMSTIVQEIAKQQLEISMHPYTSIREHQGIMSYPIFKLECCLIVPVQNEIPRCLYPVRPLKLGSWLVIFAAVVYISVTLAWTSPCVPREAPFLTKLSRTFLESIAQVVFLPSTYASQQPSLRYLLVYLQLALFGFLLTSWYNNLLSSFFTTVLVGEQLDTFESLIEAQLPILTKFHEIDMVLEQVPPELVKQVKKLIVGSNSSVQMAHLLNFNNSYAYPVTEERWNFLSLQEQYANKPINRFSKICLGSPCIGYPMRLDSHLEEPLTRFILDVQMAGLDFYWLRSDFKDALLAGYVKLVNNVFPFKALDLYTLYAAWVVLIAGLSIASFVFLLEIRGVCCRKAFRRETSTEQWLSGWDRVDEEEIKAP
ncbi:PREDICTED: uncharacterized protein LOC108972661 [Bactrocera latifrons]|uniref:uncharacterized protein LOC108972661 n=1 Tax=Bactrocera latifrons TaxID=174628 RepID=UPI0008DD21E8|nr:PREDICTED: uncharacterized protein LOC108972661 [Bactrocera latifrons]